MYDHTSSLNKAQAVANADGSYTYVVSVADPGVHNWVDTVGLRRVLSMIRIQGLSREAVDSGERLSIGSQLVKMKDLMKYLPPETRMVTPSERELQLKERRAQLQLRFLDC